MYLKFISSNSLEDLAVKLWPDIPEDYIAKDQNSVYEIVWIKVPHFNLRLRFSRETSMINQLEVFPTYICAFDYENNRQLNKIPQEILEKIHYEYNCNMEVFYAQHSFYQDDGTPIVTLKPDPHNIIEKLNAVDAYYEVHRPIRWGYTILLSFVSLLFTSIVFFFLFNSNYRIEYIFKFIKSYIFFTAILPLTINNLVLYGLFRKRDQKLLTLRKRKRKILVYVFLILPIVNFIFSFYPAIAISAMSAFY